MVLWPTRVLNPNGISIGSAVFGRPFRVSYRTVVRLSPTFAVYGRKLLHPYKPWPMSIAVKRLVGSGCRLVRRYRPRPRRHCVRWVLSSPTERGTAAVPPLFGPCLVWPKGRLSQQLLSSCTAHGRASVYFTMGRPFAPQNCPFPWRSKPLLTHGSLGQCKSSNQTVSRSVQPFLHGSLL